MDLGEKLKKVRLEAGLSQRQVCGERITRNMLSQIENGSARPSMDTLRYLEGLGAREVTCTIARDNAVSRAMHESCGFVKTDLPPVNPWGETEDGCLLYRFRTGA